MTTALQTNQRFVSAVISLLSLACPHGTGRNAPQQGRIICLCRLHESGLPVAIGRQRKVAKERKVRRRKPTRDKNPFLCFDDSGLNFGFSREFCRRAKRMNSWKNMRIVDA